MDDAHVEFLTGVKILSVLKQDLSMTAEGLMKLIHKLNPENEAGRLNIIVRMGADKIEKEFPEISPSRESSGNKCSLNIRPNALAIPLKLPTTTKHAHSMKCAK